jgi:2-polyprenyl-3-methyl-5-hydroxy-6-metoxy-1,4-benzoquinol methylase
MKVLLHVMDTLDAAHAAAPLVRLLDQGGHQVQITSEWFGVAIPQELILEGRVLHTPVCPGGFGYLPRLSEEEYDALYGQDIDWPAIQAHDAMTEGLPCSRERLFMDSRYAQMLRGFAFLFDQHVQASQPDFAIVQQGSGVFPKMMLARLWARGIPTLLWDTAFFPGKLLLDTGMHFFPGRNLLHTLAREAPALTEAQRAAARGFRDEWAAGRISKYVQQSDPQAEALLEDARASGKRLLFVPGQVPWDASVLNGLGPHASLDALWEGIRERLPEDWIFVYKPHPKYEGESQPTGFVSPQHLVLRDVDIHTLLERCDGVLTHSSNVGFEALLKGVPVACTGTPHYAGQGLSLDVETLDAIPAILARLPDFAPAEEAVLRHLHLVANEYLIDENDAAGLAARIQLARTTQPDTDPRAPFAEAYPDASQRWVALARVITSLFQRNLDSDEVLASAEVSPFLPEFGEALGALTYSGHELLSGERQVATELVDVAADHLSRYLFARELLRGGERVLDFSCGTGYGTHVLSQVEGVHATGVDCSSDAIDFATRRWGTAQCDFVRASGGTWQDDGTRYDLIATFETVEHLPSAEAFLSMLWSVLAPGGLLVLSVPDATGYALLDNPYHIRHYRAPSLRRLLGTLPGAEDVTLAAQHGARDIRAGDGGRFLIAVLQKPGGDAPRWDRTVLPFRATLPKRKPKVQYAALELYVRDRRIYVGERIEFDEGTRERFGLPDSVVCLGPGTPLAAGAYRLHVDMRAQQAPAAWPPWGKKKPRSLFQIVVTAAGGDDVIRLVADKDLPQSDGRYLVDFEIPADVPDFSVGVIHRRGQLSFGGWRIEKREPEAVEA